MTKPPTTDSLLIQANDALTEAIEALTHLTDLQETSALSDVLFAVRASQSALHESDAWKAMKEGLHGTDTR